MRLAKSLLHRWFGADPAHIMDLSDIDFEAAERDRQHLSHLSVEIARTAAKYRKDHDAWWNS